MIFALIAGLALVVLAPLLLALRQRATTRGARELGLALHRTQLQELDRDLAEGRLLPAEHKTAVLEVQRRLLAAAAAEEQTARPGARWPLVAAAVLVPAIGFGLYWVSGSQPFLPSVGANSAPARMAEQEALITELRDRLAQMDPASERGRQGYILLGNVEEARGNDRAAAAAYSTALAAKFDPTLAAQTAEATVRAEGGVSEAAAALFRRALQAAPDAPWRPLAERRLAERRGP